LLRGAPLSKDAVSRLVGRLREDFAAWAQRDLGELKIAIAAASGFTRMSQITVTTIHLNLQHQRAKRSARAEAAMWRH
jgi:hypothetical protein